MRVNTQTNRPLKSQKTKLFDMFSSCFSMVSPPRYVYLSKIKAS